jgi:hypothetical protein
MSVVLSQPGVHEFSAISTFEFAAVVVVLSAVLSGIGLDAGLGIGLLSFSVISGVGVGVGAGVLTFLAVGLGLLIFLG